MPELLICRYLPKKTIIDWKKLTKFSLLKLILLIFGLFLTISIYFLIKKDERQQKKILRKTNNDFT